VRTVAEPRVVGRRYHYEEYRALTRKTYRIAESCWNCGAKWVAIYKVGDRANYMAERPECECRTVHHGTTAEAEALLQAAVPPRRPGG
jgi:hypothetical protein